MYEKEIVALKEICVSAGMRKPGNTFIVLDTLTIVIWAKQLKQC